MRRMVIINKFPLVSNWNARTLNVLRGKHMNLGLYLPKVTKDDANKTLGQYLRWRIK